jgi:multiple sugar transport system substrate-binding protein
MHPHARRVVAVSLAASVAGLAAPARADEATVTLAMHYTQEQAAPLLACLETYNAETEGVTVEYQQLSYRDYLQTVLTSRLGGTQADIYNLYSIWGAQMVQNGVLAEPPEAVAEFVREAYIPGTVEAATIEGTLWGVPTEVSVYMLVSNMELLRAAGHDAPPATWEELREIAADVTTRNDQGRIEEAGFAFLQSSTGAGVVHPFYALMFSEGGAPYENGMGAARLDSEEAQAALARMAGLVEDDLTDRTVDGYDFPARGIGMVIMANWFESAIREGFGDSFDDAVRVSPIPAGEDWRTLQYAFFMGVDSQSDVQDEAWEVVRWLNSPDSAGAEGGASCMGRMLDGLGALTANVADTEALGPRDAFTEAYWQALQADRAVSQPNVMQAAEIEGMMAETFDRVIAGEAEPGPALQRLDGEIEAILGEFY